MRSRVMRWGSGAVSKRQRFGPAQQQFRDAPGVQFLRRSDRLEILAVDDTPKFEAGIEQTPGEDFWIALQSLHGRRIEFHGDGCGWFDAILEEVHPAFKNQRLGAFGVHFDEVKLQGITGVSIIEGRAGHFDFDRALPPFLQQLLGQSGQSRAAGIVGEQMKGGFAGLIGGGLRKQL